MTGNGNEPDTTHASVGQFDDIDETILSILEKDGRATLSQLSDATGLSISAVQSRVQKLERRNVILGYKAVIDDEKRGLAVRAYIAVTPIDYSKEAEIPAKLQDIEGIMSCDSVAGSPSYMLTVRAASPSKLEDLLNVIHQTVPVSTETTIVLQRYFSKWHARGSLVRMSDSEHDWLRPEEEHETETVIDAGTAQSNPEVADAVAKIAALRQSIDNVDTAIVSLLAERFKYTSQVGVLKAREGFAPADYKREDYQIERLHRIAVDAGLDPDIAEMYREFVVTEAKRRHKRIAENGVDPGALDVFA